MSPTRPNSCTTAELIAAQTSCLESIASSSFPTKSSIEERDPSFAEQDPLREARKIDEGVCTSNIFIGCSVTEPNSTLAPPTLAERGTCGPRIHFETGFHQITLKTSEPKSS
ncbi:uncharacterized protein VP01_4338g2 [Puccinia sorghi]|uniref:Uncharacterized protein n=1 Tax=Puccinia sorghi TaxID=27349 RepID=A0A0L6UPX0_9BASI|nr:uncharacterized protein VP01_4338g2 [Puccinia sorghi]